MRFTVVVEEGESSFGAFVPDLPGCVATGDSAEDAKREIQEAISFHIEGLRLEGRIASRAEKEYRVRFYLPTYAWTIYFSFRHSIILLEWR